jgi:hypothetical protein
VENWKQIGIGVLAAVGIVAIVLGGWHLWNDHQNLDKVIPWVAEMQRQQAERQRQQPARAPQPPVVQPIPAPTPENK